MRIYKILGLLLTASPIVIATDNIFFPYSILGLTLFIMTLIIEELWTVESVIEIFLWLGMVLCIVTYQPQIYIVFQAYFAIICYIFLSIRPVKFQILIAAGLICSVGMIFSPMLHTASYIFLSFLFFLDKYSNKLSEQPLIDYDNAEMVIPETTTNEEEADFVIPAPENQENMD